MVRGRRPRAAVQVRTGGDDQFAASPKRKDSKLDLASSPRSSPSQKMTASSVAAGSTAAKSPDFMGFTKTRARAITNYFPFAQKDLAIINHHHQHHDENARDSYDLTGNSSNIFLQTPVLHLNIDKSPNQASSITINKHIDVRSNFSSLTSASNLNNGGVSFVTSPAVTATAIGSEERAATEDNNDTDRTSDDDGHVTRSPSLASAPESSDYISSDSNSCDSGVVADRHLELSPSKRRKPMTPHRIVCPSPVKHAVVVAEKSPTSALSNLNIGNKKNPTKTRRRLNANKGQNRTVNPTPTTTVVRDPPSINEDDDTILAVALTEEVPAAIFEATPEQPPTPPAKAILNANTQCAQHNNITTNNNLNINNNTASTKATKLTDFFPVRRSVRKTKKAVEQEQLRNIEAAIRTQQEDGLVVAEFPFKGRGIMAARRFARGEFVIEYIGDLIDMTEANRREQLYAKDENTGCYMYYFKHKSQQHCIDATAESGKLGRLVNHSRNGNLVTKTVFYRNQPHLVLLAKDCIEVGEELTYDYGDRSKESLLHHPWLAL